MAEQFPLVSVIVPVYNHEDFVGEALRSVFRQTYPALELVVVDDGSSDGSAEVIREILTDSPIPCQFLDRSHQGAPAALNLGIGTAKGDYLAILNSDDRYCQGRLAGMISRLERSPARFAFSAVKHIDGNGDPLTEADPYRYYYQQSLQDAGTFPTPSFEIIRHNYAVSTGNFLFQRDLFQEVGPFQDYQTCHDWDFILRVILIEEPLFCQEAWYEYRIHSQNTLANLPQVREEEIDTVISQYLRGMEGAGNRLAPTPDNWGAYWTYFSSRYLDHYLAYETAAGLLGPMVEGVILSESGERIMARAGRRLHRMIATRMGGVRWTTELKSSWGMWLFKGLFHLVRSLFPGQSR